MAQPTIKQIRSKYPTKPALAEWAMEHMSLDFSEDDFTYNQMIAEIEETMKLITEQEAALDADDPDGEPEPVDGIDRSKYVPAQLISQATRRWIVLAEGSEDTGSLAARVQLNGHVSVVPRNVACNLPEPVIAQMQTRKTEVRERAVNPDTGREHMVKRLIPRYSIRDATDSEIRDAENARRAAESRNTL